MSQMSEKVILTDCDGVLLDWEHGFDAFMNELGYKAFDYTTYKMGDKYEIPTKQAKEYIQMFNKSACMRFLTPFRDAVKYVRKLHEEHGYVFHVITSQTENIFAKKLREQNLKSLFGDTIFQEINILPCGADKDDALEKYRDSGCFWVEDKPENVNVGQKLGLNGILIAHNHNMKFSVEPGVKRLYNWKQIYEHITGVL